MVRALRILGVLLGLAALVLFLRAGYPELFTGRAESTWAPQGLRGLSGPLGVAALLLAAAAATALLSVARPRRHAIPATFLDESEKQAVREAIAAAEARTRGEIRVHLACRSGGKPLQAARAVFESIGMTRTAGRTGVLIYLSVEDRAFAVVGDQGIHEVVPEGFWDDVRAGMSARFAEERFTEGIVEAVRAAGDQLSRFFPRDAGDVDELPDEISVEPRDPGSP